jgi:predicted nucleic acid-binding protein
MIIDTNIFLEVLLEQEKCNNCRAFLRDFVKGDKIGFLTTFSIDSIVISMLNNDKDEEKVKIFLASLFKYKGLKFYQFKIKDRINALSLMAKYKLDYEDALVLQSAFATNSKEILSFDKHFDKVKEIKRIEP